ncbi:MAG: CPBP family intramembrane metalloprotease [Oscillospiraceae bacterium]|nr:CPBP family intramembrane metalloprotease [Oscillospiraceae bacterium]
MQLPSKSRLIWQAIYPVLIFVGVQFVVTIVAIIGWVVYYTLNAPLDSLDIDKFVEELVRWTTENTLAITFVFQIISLIPLWLIWRGMRKWIPQYQKNPGTALIAASCAASCIGLTLLVGILLSFVDVGESYALLEEALSSGSVVIQFLALAIGAPIVEELCFRGIVLNRLLLWNRPWVAVLVQAAMFGLVHMNLVQGLYAFAVGAVFGYLYVRYRKLWLCIVGHFAFNLPNVIVGLIEDMGVELTLYALLIPGVLLLAVGAFFLMRCPAAVPVMRGAGCGMQNAASTEAEVALPGSDGRGE